MNIVRQSRQFWQFWGINTFIPVGIRPRAKRRCSDGCQLAVVALSTADAAVSAALSGDRRSTAEARRGFTGDATAQRTSKQQIPIRTTIEYGPCIRPYIYGPYTRVHFFDTRTYGTYVRAVCTGSPYRSAVYTARMYGCQKFTRLYGP